MNRISPGAACLAALILFCSLGIPVCLADPQPVTGHHYDGDSPPPGSIVAREQGGTNHIGFVNTNGTIDDIIPRDANHPSAARYDIPYSQWKTEDGSIGKGAWVPDLTDAQRQAVCRKVRDNLANAQDFQLYPNNRGPDQFNCLGVPVQSYADCDLALPVTDRPELTPTELFFGLTGRRMNGLQHFEVSYPLPGVICFTADVLTPDGRTERMSMLRFGSPSDLEEVVQRVISGDPKKSAESSGGGGVESRPLWLGPSGAVESKSPSARGSVGASGLLHQFVPDLGPNGETGVPVEPRNVMGGSNAVAAIGMDYRTAGGEIAAAIFGAETADGMYEHDYPVCSRVQLSEVDAVMPIRHDGHWWWTIRAHSETEDWNELALQLSVRLDGAQAVVDSRYLVESYPPGVTGTVLNYQIRARDICSALYYLHAILDKLAQTYTVVYTNTTEPALPTVFAHTANYDSGNIRLLLKNQREATTVHFSGPVWTEPRAEAETTVEFDIEVPAGESTVNLPVGHIHDAVIYIQSGGFTDKVYVAAGYWFAWDDRASGGTSAVAVTMSALEHASLPGAAEWSVSPPQAEMTGRVTDALEWGHVGIGYTFRQAAQPIDVSAADSVAFWVKGDGKEYRVKLESTSVADNDFHGFTFTAPTDWRVVRIPFSELAQEGWGTPVAWTGTDIRTISFVTVGRPHESVHLFVDRISFLQTGARTDLIDPIKRTTNGSDAAAFGAIITAVFGDSFYVEASDRSSGIHVTRVAHGFQEGDKVDFGGIARTDSDGERYVEASCAQKVGTGNVKPVGMNIRALGGTNYNYELLTGAGQQGVTDLAYGLNNIGMLVRTWGRSAYLDPSSFILTDGSGAELRCVVPEGVSLDSEWNYVAVTGINSCYTDGSQTKRMLRVRRQADIIPLW